MSNGNEMASPALENDWDHNAERWVYSLVGGLTKREAFAMAAMQGILGSEYVMKFSDDALDADPTTTRGKWLAKQAVGFADALLAALDPPK
jgi:hypothetical protein